MTPKTREPLEIIEGDKDGVKVIVDRENGRAVATMPYNYDCYFMFVKKDKEGIPYAERFDSIDKSKIALGVGFQDLGTGNKVREFNQNVGLARQVSKDMHEEKELYQTVIAFDHLDGKKGEYKQSMPESKYAIGEVVHAGKFFCVLKQGISGDKQYFQVINNFQVLRGRDEFLNREEVIKEKMVIGSVKYLVLENTGRITVSDYKAKLVQAPEQEVALPITREQKEALMAYREAKISQGDDWKEKLGADWTKETYPGVSKAHAPLLQQVRNQQGPEWLRNLNDKDLYLGTTQETAKVEAKKPEVKKSKVLTKEM